jgi:DNA invertase Pin-like site-specific DNA recombinase
MMQMVGSFAEFERAMIQERTSAGLAAARAEGSRTAAATSQ